DMPSTAFTAAIWRGNKVPLLTGKCTARSSTRRISSGSWATAGREAGSVSSIGETGLVMVVGNGREGRLVDTALRHDMSAPRGERAARRQGCQIRGLAFNGCQAMRGIGVQAWHGRHEPQGIGMT